MNPELPSLVVVLGPTATGKTRLGAALARRFGGEIISADSRQVYRGLDIGSGKDLDEYRTGGPPVPYHLIDIVDLGHEFSVFEYQRRFFEVFLEVRERGVLPVLVGGTGLYIESVLRGYRMVEAPENPELREELATLSPEALEARLRALKPDLHNTTDLSDRNRLMRAIEIAEYSREHEPEPAPPVHPVILGVRRPLDALRAAIRRRLRERLDAGMIDEVRGLLDSGVTPGKLHFLGLEYRFVAEFLQGGIRNRNDLEQKLAAAIYQFARRQLSWFRRMERHGTTIHWLDGPDPEAAAGILHAHGLHGEE